MKSKLIIRQDKNKESNELRELRCILSEMQKSLNWFNSLEYANPLTDLRTVKQYLSDTYQFHETIVKQFLLKKSGLPELPPNDSPLRTMYNIKECFEYDFSDKPYFDNLELNDGILSYSKETFSSVHEKHIQYATKQQEVALKELNRMKSDIEIIANIMFPAGGYLKEQYLKSLLNDLGLSKLYTGSRSDENVLIP
jgi:predicted translin family RNA/ssDNA-binding protein